MFAPLQTRIAAALLTPSAPTPPGIVAEPSRAPQKRFAVYRNNVVHGLIEALRARFPVVERIVGDEFFAAMAQEYVTAHPPRTRMMMAYGDDFPDFIAAFAPAAELTYLSDVARLEAARTRAYHAADAEPLPVHRLGAIGEDALNSLRLRLHPSHQVVCSAHPIVTIWAMNSGERALAPIDDTIAEDALVIRPQLTVEVRALPPGGATFITALSAGPPLAEAVSAALATCPGFDLAANLAGLFTAGVVIGFATGDEEEFAP